MGKTGKDLARGRAKGITRDNGKADKTENSCKAVTGEGTNSTELQIQLNSSP